MATGKNIKGITIEIAGNTTKLDAALKGVNSESIALQKELKQVDKLLKFDPGNTELIAQQQQILAKNIEATAKKLDTLKEAQAQVDAQFSSGKINEEQYRAFNREVINTETALNGLKTKLDSVGQAQQDLESKTKQLETLFKATGTNVDNFADALGVNLTNAIKNGTASSKQLDIALDKIGKSSLGASADIEKMKLALKSIDDGASLKAVQKDLSNVAKESKAAGDEINSLGSDLTSVIGGLAAGGGIAGTISKALDTSNLKAKIDIAFDVPEESKASVREAIKGIEAYGVDGQEALEGVRRQWALNKTASDEVNAAIVKGAGAIASSYAGIDFIELIQETNEIASALKISNEEALGLTNALLKAGFPPEQLDTISEYGQQMKDAGFSAKEIQAIFEAGIDTKTWNIDNLNDGVKEARIQMATFGLEVPDALASVLEKTDVSAKQFQEWGKSVAKGGDEGSKALSDMVTWLDGIEDKAVKNEIATKVFGTKWEDQGQNMISVFKGVGDAMDKTGQNADGLKESIATLDSSPAVKLQQAMSDMNTALEPLLTKVAEFVTKIAEWVSNNPQLAATITTIATVLGILTGALVLIVPIITGLVTSAGALGISIGAIVSPVLIVVGVIASLIAIGVALYKNWDEVSAIATKTWAAIKDAISKAWEGIKSVTETVWNGIKSFLTNLWDFIQTTISTVWGIIKSTVANTVNSIFTTVSSIFTRMKESIANIMSSVKEVISGYWDRVMEFFKGIDLFQTGKDIIKGLMDGISNMATALWDKVKSIADGIKDAFTDVLDINSPSRVFRGYGINLNEGLILGIEESARKLNSVMDNVYGSMSNSVQGMMQTSGNTNNSSSYDYSRKLSANVSINAGASAQEIARANERALQRLAFQLNL